MHLKRLWTVLAFYLEDFRVSLISNQGFQQVAFGFILVFKNHFGLSLVTVVNHMKQMSGSIPSSL